MAVLTMMMMEMFIKRKLALPLQSKVSIGEGGSCPDSSRMSSSITYIHVNHKAECSFKKSQASKNLKPLFSSVGSLFFLAWVLV